MAVLYIFYITF